AVERVDQEQVFAALVGLGDRDRPLHLLGGEGGEVAAPDVGLEQDLVRQNIQLLLHFALDVFLPGGTQAIRQGALVDPGADRLAGAGDGLEQQAQVGVDRFLLLPADEELGQGDSLHAGYFILRRANQAPPSSPAATRANTGVIPRATEIAPDASGM